MQEISDTKSKAMDMKNIALGLSKFKDLWTYQIRQNVNFSQSWREKQIQNPNLEQTPNSNGHFQQEKVQHLP